MKISVVMTCYNSSKYIKEQLDSIFRELPLDSELIISDDCSKDNTIDIIKSYNDPRIILLINRVNLGPNLNFQRCLEKVSGNIIVISDSDNVWYSGKINKVLPYFDDKKVNMVMHDAIITNELLEPIRDSYFSWRKSKPGLLRNIIKNGYGGSMMAFRTTCLKYILPFPKRMPFFFDEWIGMMCEKHGKCIFIDDKLSAWRRHDNVVSSLSVNEKNVDIKKEKFKRIKRLYSFAKDRSFKIWFAITH